MYSHPHFHSSKKKKEKLKEKNNWFSLKSLRFGLFFCSFQATQKSEYNVFKKQCVKSLLPTSSLPKICSEHIAWECDNIKWQNSILAPIANRIAGRWNQRHFCAFLPGHQCTTG
jgi:hypothetical protein